MDLSSLITGLLMHSGALSAFPPPHYLSTVWAEHYAGQWDHLLAALPGGVPQLCRLLLADHGRSWLRHQSQLHPASGARASRLHHRLVRSSDFLSAELF